MASNGSTGDMEKPNQDPQQPQPHLKCPRCDSSNTKFCYYNNYSLSQPRHFCKACKRYWTRGGTLRNVPVGGGCRKNKRIRRPSAAAPSAAADLTLTSSSAPNNLATKNITNPSHNHNHHIHDGLSHIDLSSSTTSNHHLNHPLFYGLTNERSDLNHPFARLFSSRVAIEGQAYSLTGMDHRLGLGFSTSGENYGPNGYNPIKQIQDSMAGNSTTSTSQLLSSYPMFGSSSSSTSTMASLIASSLQQQKFMSNGNNFHGLAHYEELQMSGNNNNVEGGGNGELLKEEKMEGGDGQNRSLNWNNLSSHQNQIEQMISSDPSLSWNGAWLDPSNLGSSVPSLI